MCPVYCSKFRTLRPLSDRIWVVSVPSTATKPLRADAQRNYDALVEAAKRVFAVGGADAPLEDVAREAGVGQGTLYRHFRTREHLFVAILEDRVGHLDARAKELLHAPDPLRALSDWLRLYDRIAGEFGGMSARLGKGLIDADSPVAALCAPMKASFQNLFERAQRERPLRSDVSAVEVLAIVSALPKHPRSGATIAPALDIVLRGLRA
jgi:AcrR family transcriptional regulator